MLLIRCPWCGERAESEFHCGGEAHIDRPRPDASDERWAAYLYQRYNANGLIAERWVHRHGCRRWFHIVRDTGTHEIRAVYRMGEPRPV